MSTADAASLARFDAEVAKLGILFDASGVLIGPLDATKLRALVRLAQVTGVSLSVNSSEQVIASPSPADTGTA